MPCIASCTSSSRQTSTCSSTCDRRVGTVEGCLIRAKAGFSTGSSGYKWYTVGIPWGLHSMDDRSRFSQSWMRTMRHHPLAVAAVVLLAAESACHRSPSQAPYVDHRIEIVGSDNYVGRVKDALALLADRAPDAFADVERYVGRIQHSERSAMWAHFEPPTYKMSDRTAMASLTWCAGSIVHEAHHSKLYHEYRAAHGTPVPSSAYGGVRRERECIEQQLKVARRIGASRYEIQYLESLDGTHGDVDKDGDSDWADYFWQDW